MSVTNYPLISGVPSIKARKAPHTAVAIGDSITGNGHTSTATKEGVNARGYFYWANVLLKQNLQFLNYAGVSGEECTEIEARFKTAALNYDPDFIFMHCGLNDITNSIATTVTRPSIQRMIVAAAAINATVVLFTLHAVSTWTTTQLAAVMAHNRWLWEQEASYSNIIIIDAAKVIVNPTDAGLAAVTNALYDTTHLSSYGAYLVGSAVYDAFQYITPAKRRGVISVSDHVGYNSSLYNIFQNSLFQGVGGTAGTGVTGSVPNGLDLSCSGSMTVTTTISAAADGIGNSLDLAITASAGGEICTLKLLTADAHYADMNQNDTYWLETDLDVSGADITLIRGIYAEFTVNGTYQSVAGSYNTADFLTNVAYAGRMKSKPRVISEAAPTASIIRMTVVAQAAGTFTVKFSNLVAISQP